MLGNRNLDVLITHVNSTPISYKIPSFEVITLQLRKVTCVVEGEECQGLIKDEGTLTVALGHYVCNSSCKIIIDNQQYLVLWELQRHTNNLTAQTRNGTMDQQSGPHSLPFKVLGSCYDTSRQKALEEAYEYLYDYNRSVFVKLEAESDNAHDRNAIGVYIMTNCEYVLVGYIASELTKYIHPFLATSELDVSVKRIHFCTTYLKIGFYLSIEITINSAWPEEVVQASKKVL